MGRTAQDLHSRVFLQSPEAIRKEVDSLLVEMDPAVELSPLHTGIGDCVRLFDGRYPGYRRCNTLYHDVSHTLAVFLAAARLMHAVHHAHPAVRLSSRTRVFGLLNALFHDAGLIQTEEDTEGTGAKYTDGHEARSIRFLKLYLEKRRFFENRIGDCAHIIGATIVALSTEEIPFRNDRVRLAACIVGSADLLAQMADRLYLEKLLYLYREFQEAGMSEFTSELDLLKKTESFYRNVSRERLRKELGGVDSLMRVHFQKRFGLDRDFYQESIDKNMLYLRRILMKHERDYRNMLRRAGIVRRLERAS